MRTAHCTLRYGGRRRRGRSTRRPYDVDRGCRYLARCAAYPSFYRGYAPSLANFQLGPTWLCAGLKNSIAAPLGILRALRHPAQPREPTPRSVRAHPATATAVPANYMILSEANDILPGAVADCVIKPSKWKWRGDECVAAPSSPPKSLFLYPPTSPCPSLSPVRARSHTPRLSARSVFPPAPVLARGIVRSAALRT